MAFVVDASIAGAWLLPDEDNVIVEQAMIRMADEDAWAPDLLRHEIRRTGDDTDGGRRCLGA